MPAEWEPHEATWIAWPHNEDDWPGRFEPIPWVYGEIVRKLSQVEQVRILVQNGEVEDSARNILMKSGANLEAIEFFSQPTDRVWTRDFGPMFVKSDAGHVAAVKWRFNGWAKYENHLRDEAAGHAIAGFAEVPVTTPDFVLEGGSIEVNGAGWLMTTEECLLSPIQQRIRAWTVKASNAFSASISVFAVSCGLAMESWETILTDILTIWPGSPPRFRP